MPPWSAWTVQTPVPTSVIVAPLRPPEVQTDGVVVVKDTGRPDDAVADAVTGDAASVTSDKAPKVIVWSSFV